MPTLKRRYIKPIVLNAILGDGCLVKQVKGCYLRFISTNIDWLNYKRELCRKYKPTNFRTQSSGYGGRKTIYVFCTRQHEEINRARNLTYTDCISMLEKIDLIMWYLDDGTYHQKKHFMHLYCNKLSEQEVELLADKIYELYPIKRPTLRWDKKKDGRKYPYLYIPVKTANKFREDVEKFIKENEIFSMLYKVGL